MGKGKTMGQLDGTQEFNLYRDISQRTGGEIYIGVVGPVRTGKSTFIKRFMDLMVLPQIENEHERTRTQDELPQSSGGRTITTTEPKFIPKEAAQIEISDGINVKVRLIDCVGYMVEGARTYGGRCGAHGQNAVVQRGNPIHTGGGDWH